MRTRAARALGAARSRRSDRAAVRADRGRDARRGRRRRARGARGGAGRRPRVAPVVPARLPRPDRRGGRGRSGRRSCTTTSCATASIALAGRDREPDTRRPRPDAAMLEIVLDEERGPVARRAQRRPPRAGHGARRHRRDRRSRDFAADDPRQGHSASTARSPPSRASSIDELLGEPERLVPWVRPCRPLPASSAASRTQPPSEPAAGPRRGRALRRGRERDPGRARHRPSRARRAAVGRATCWSRACPAPARPCSPSPSPPRSVADSAACSARPTSSRPTSPVRRCTARDRQLGLPAGPDLRERRARRRGQPRVAAHPGRVARADGGAPGHRRRRHAPLPDPFFLVATQNPFGTTGTFPLPESQLDRFALVRTIGLPGTRRRTRDPRRCRRRGRAASLEAVTDAGRARRRDRRRSRDVHSAHAVRDYVLDVADATRNHPGRRARAHRRGRAPWLRARAGARDGHGAATSCPPDDVKSVAPRCSRTGSCSAPVSTSPPATQPSTAILDSLATPRP